MRQTPTERREQCNPTLIGIFVGAVSPLSSLIWGIRQRSLKLALFPYLFVFIAGFIILSLANETKFKPEFKIPLQLIAGYYSFDITKKMKEEALKNKNKALDAEIKNN